MVFFRDNCVSSVLESSFTTCKLRFCARCFLALTKKSSFLEAPLKDTAPFTDFQSMVIRDLRVHAQASDARVRPVQGCQAAWAKAPPHDRSYREATRHSVIQGDGTNTFHQFGNLACRVIFERRKQLGLIQAPVAGDAVKQAR